MEDYDNSFEEDYDNSFEEGCYDNGDFEGSGGCGNHTKLGCLKAPLIIIGVFMGFGMFLMTMTCILPKGNTEETLLGFAISVVGLVALWSGFKIR